MPLQKNVNSSQSSLRLFHLKNNTCCIPAYKVRECSKQCAKQFSLSHEYSFIDTITQTRSGQARSGQARPGQARPGQARPGQARPGQARPGQARPGQARPGQARPDELRQHESYLKLSKYQKRYNCFHGIHDYGCYFINVIVVAFLY